MQRRDVDEPLVAAAPEIERQVAQRLDVAAVHQRVDPAQALPARRVREALLERIARIAPDVLPRALPHPAQKGRHRRGMQQRIAAADGHTVQNRVRRDRIADPLRPLRGQRFAAQRIVALRIVAPGTTVRTPREIDRVAQAVAIRDGFGINGQDTEWFHRQNRVRYTFPAETI